MRLFNTLAVCVLTGLASTMAYGADEQQIVAEPNTLVTGQTVTLKWYFTGDKVTVTGGRYKQGTVVTGRQRLTDKPDKTTRYTFDVTYHGMAPGADGKKVNKLLHTRYSVVVDVFRMPEMLPYRASNGWRVNYVKGWQCDNIPTAEIRKDGLVFFQPEDDSVERLAVAVVPAQNMTADDLMKKVEADMPTHYNDISVLSRTTTTYRNMPAVLTTFTGIDTAHPGTRTESMVLTFIHDGKGYVISGRTKAEQYKTHGLMLDRMVRSFSFNDNTTTVSTR